MKRAWTRSEKWLWPAPLLFGVIAGAATFGPNVVSRLLGWPQVLMTTPDTEILAMALSGNGEILAAGGTRYDFAKKRSPQGSGEVHLWNARTGKPLTAMAPVYTRDSRGFWQGSEIESLTLSPDAKQIGIGRRSANWTLYDIATQKLLWAFPGSIQHAEFSRDGRVIVLSSYRQTWVVNSIDGKVRTQWKRVGGSNSQDVALSPDGKLVAIIGSSTDDDPIEFHRADNGKFVRRTPAADADSVAFSSDGKRLVTAGSITYPESIVNTDIYAPVRCYDVATGKLIWDVKKSAIDRNKTSGTSFCGAIFSPDGHTVAVYRNFQNKVFLFDSDTGKVKTTFSAEKPTNTGMSRPPALAFAPDGKRLFARGKNAILFWDLP